MGLDGMMVLRVMQAAQNNSSSDHFKIYKLTQKQVSPSIHLQFLISYGAMANTNMSRGMKECPVPWNREGQTKAGFAGPCTLPLLLSSWK